MDPLTWSFLATKVLEQVFKRGTGQLVGMLLPGSPGLAADLAALTDEMRQREPAVASQKALRYLRTDETNQARERLISTVSQLGTAAAAHALLFLLDAAGGNQASAEEALHHAMMLNPFLLHGLLAQSGQPIHLPALLGPVAVSRPVPASSPTEGELDQLRRAFIAQLGLDDLLPVLAISS